ncbi:MAG: hypothetical protein NZ870_00880 [bacterium]|nr:hypothetical protein [bacterium]
MRSLITGETTYKAAFFAFLFLALYLGTRPIQLLYPYPWVLFVNNIRELLMIGLFSPATFAGVVTFAYFEEHVPKTIIKFVFYISIITACVFFVVNIYAIGGSEVLFTFMGREFHDGLWFKNPDPEGKKLMNVLFVCRLISPVIVVSIAGIIAIIRGLFYPLELKQIYNAMPIKLLLLGLACLVFSLSMLTTGLLYVFEKIPNQWWIYYVGAVLSGILELISITIPSKRKVKISDFKE